MVCEEGGKAKSLSLFDLCGAHVADVQQLQGKSLHKHLCLQKDVRLQAGKTKGVFTRCQAAKVCNDSVHVKLKHLKQQMYTSLCHCYHCILHNRQLTTFSSKAYREHWDAKDLHLLPCPCCLRRPYTYTKACRLDSIKPVALSTSHDLGLPTITEAGAARVGTIFGALIHLRVAGSLA